MANQFSARLWPISKIRGWVEEGKTLLWIAEILGCSNQHIARLCKKNRIETRRTGPRGGPGHPNWKGGRMISKSGYVLVYAPDHPHAKRTHKSGGYMPEHRLVMEAMIGRRLRRGEVVHHRNKNKQDNHPDNLQLFSSNGKHLQFELKGKCPNWSKEGREKIRNIHIGKTVSPETRRKISLANQGRKPTPEQRVKMSAAAKRLAATRPRDAKGRLLPKAGALSNNRTTPRSKA